MEEAENLCHKVAIMDKGRIIIEGNPKDLIHKYDQEDGNLENVFLSLTGKELRD
jgi:ABC-2 type transport system ATP-binding protein